MKILYISTITSRNYLEANGISNATYSVAEVKFAQLIEDGLKNCGAAVRSVYTPPFSSYPGVNKIWFKHYRDSDSIYVGFINLHFLKQLTLVFSLIREVKTWYSSNKTEKLVILFPSIQLIYSIVAKWARNKGIIVVTYVPDLPQFQYYYTKKQSSLIKRIFTPVYISLTNSLNHVYDGYVFMTKYMESLFPKRPSIIIEGIVPTNDREVCTIARENDVFVVMYAGSLHESMGVRKLVDAFGEGLDDVELWIYGSGDSEEYIMEKAKNHNNIKFYGRVKYETILEQEKKADLLVNPRCSENEFTKYSFPSKLMEYMQSGTPVLTTRLKGIPEDYYDYMFFIDNETIDGVRSAIRETLSLGKETLCQIGEKASRYVLHNKNSTVQASKVYYFLNSATLLQI